MKNRKFIPVVVLICLVTAVTIFGLSHSSSKKVPTKTTISTTSHIFIKDYMFDPTPVRVKIGTTITWTNEDAVAHTVTADGNSSNGPASMNIGEGASYSYTFHTAGTYTYHCTPHPFMHGTVIVTE